MRLTRIPILCSILFSCLLLPTHASNIYIHTENLPDLQALQSNNSESILSVSTNLLALKKVHAKVQFEYMTTKRSLQFMDKGHNICIVDKIKTKERLAKYIFSQPINLFLGRRLYQKASSSMLVKHMLTDNKVNLYKLFEAQPKAQLLVTEQISYGDALDEQIALLPDKNKLIRQGAAQDIAIREMFALGRADFALLYPQQVFTYLPKLKVRSYEIEAIPPYVLGHLMCTNTPENQSLLEEINNHLNMPQSRDDLLDIHLKFIKPSDKQIFINYFEQEF